MKTFDVVILTDHRYVAPKARNAYINNVLLEDELVKKALENKGYNVTRKSWDDPDFNWESTKSVLFRTTWDYFDRFDLFMSWLQQISEKVILINNVEVIRWNLDKHYLEDLRKSGVNIPPTRFIEMGSTMVLSDLLLETGWNRAVLKPCVSGAARHTYIVDTSNHDYIQTILEDLIKKEAFLFQEFQENIVSEGELSLMWFDGQVSHAVLKKAKPGDFRVQDDFGGSVYVHQPNEEEIQFAIEAVKATGFDLLYARVDLFRDNNGALCLAELELIEPELWFRNYPEGAGMLASGIGKFIN